VSLQNIRVVLVHPTHPGNIGAVARAMKTMCLQNLHLVAPVDYGGSEAAARAAGAADLLVRARSWPSLMPALADCGLVIGTSARTRSIRWPALEPRAAAERLLTAAREGAVALLFGREKMGLTNAELDLCHHVVAIPANPDCSSLNLACAVQVMGYEILRASKAPLPPVTDSGHEPAVQVARVEDMERFYRHLEEVLIQVGFLDPLAPRRLMRRLHRLFNRAELDEREVNILRGILAAIQARLGGSASER
jgi:tRNA (cytidine32/uridine32-2'-O)-methyltransferase